MTPYANLSGNSGIYGYEIGDNYIIILFNSGESYKYSDISAGMDIVEEMKLLAKQGTGLHKFINNYAKNNYEW